MSKTITTAYCSLGVSNYQMPQPW